MSDSDFWSKVNKVIQATKCSKINAIEAVYTTYGVDDAIKKARDSSYYIGGGESGLAVQDNIKKIVLFKDGILTEESFYSFSDRNNLRLKQMLEKGEFDADVLGGKPGDEVNVKFIDLKELNYNNEDKKLEEPTKKESNFEICKIECPDSLFLDENGDVCFKVFVGHKKVNVKMSKEQKIADLCNEFRKYCKKNFSLVKDNVKLDENESCEILNSCLVVLKCEK